MPAVSRAWGLQVASQNRVWTAVPIGLRGSLDGYDPTRRYEKGASKAGALRFIDTASGRYWPAADADAVTKVGMPVADEADCCTVG